MAFFTFHQQRNQGWKDAPVFWLTDLALAALFEERHRGLSYCCGESGDGAAAELAADLGADIGGIYSQCCVFLSILELCVLSVHQQDCQEITSMAMGFQLHLVPEEYSYVKGIGRLTEVGKNPSVLFSIGRQL